MSSLSARVELPPVARSVPAARRVLLELLQAWGAPHDAEDAALLLTELVTNVIDHVGGANALTVELTFSGAWLRIAVVDGSAIRPVVRELDRENPRGRGLRMVQEIADRWGADEEGDGKRVWFDIAPVPSNDTA